MYMVYWSAVEEEKMVPYSKGFNSDQMKEALAFLEALRKKQRNGEPVRFITMCSENPNVVGPPGVAEPGADYDWKKRRS
jgi:hypothetical protein